MIKFIKHGGFILKLSEIKYIEIIDGKNIEVSINSDGKERKFIMEYDAPYEAQNALNKLTLDVEAWVMAYDWKHAFVQETSFLRSEIGEIQNAIKKLSKEFELTRKLFSKDKSKDKK